SKAELAALSCQGNYDAATGARGTCGSTVDGWAAAGRIETALVWSCTSGALCTIDRLDLVAGKTFYEPGQALFLPLDAAVEEAFRYKLRFQSDAGRTVGFAPVICDPSSDLTPYCYEPEAIEALRARIDCMAAIYLAYAR